MVFIFIVYIYTGTFSIFDSMARIPRFYISLLFGVPWFFYAAMKAHNTDSILSCKIVIIQLFQ